MNMNNRIFLLTLSSSQEKIIGEWQALTSAHVKIKFEIFTER